MNRKTTMTLVAVLALAGWCPAEETVEIGDELIVNGGLEGEYKQHATYSCPAEARQHLRTGGGTLPAGDRESSLGPIGYQDRVRRASGGRGGRAVRRSDTTTRRGRIPRHVRATRAARLSDYRSGFVRKVSGFVRIQEVARDALKFLQIQLHGPQLCGHNLICDPGLI